jgi:GR25 family glycosyltransferase involved in LPS biosynthesis
MKTKIIVLQNSKISMSMGSKCIARAKEFGINAEIFHGIDGRDAHEVLASLKLRQYKAKMKGGRLGVLGCFLSHYFLWNECYKSQEPMMILEHDAYMLRPLPKKVLKRFPDVLKLDSLDPYRDTYNDELKAQTEDVRIWSLHERKKHGKFKHYRGLYSIGGYGYIIKPHAALEIITQAKVFGFRPADHMLYTTDKMDIHHISPSIVRIHRDYHSHEAMKLMSLTRNLEKNSLRTDP